jgi:pimeloyl-ACP methyl ester carboxylesterase
MIEKISIQGKGKLSAYLQKPCTDYRGPIAVLMHGFMANKKLEPLKSIANELENRGIASLRFDFDGHGESEGRFRDMTVLTELEDARRVIDHVRRAGAYDSIALVGHSQGGVVAGMLAGELGDEIKALVQLAPAAVLKDDALQGVLMGKHYDPYNPPETLTVFFHRVGKGYFLAAQSLPIYEQSSLYKGPVLLIHGTKDKIVPHSFSEKYDQVYSNSILQLYEGENHFLSKCRKAIVRQTVDFLAANFTK